MEGNGNGREIGSFEWLLGQRLRFFQSAGASPYDIETIKSRGAAMAAVLSEFRQKRRQAGDSGKYTREGLRDLLAELASEAKGKILHEQNGDILAKQIRGLEAKLAAPTAMEKEEKLLAFWRQMEVRAHFERLGLTIVDPVAGTVRFDTLKADALYRDAMSRGDDTAMEALEQWPAGSPVSPDLIEQGKRQRLLARDPVLAGQLTEALRFQEAWNQTVSDALAELREFLPVDDPIARLVAGDRAT